MHNSVQIRCKGLYFYSALHTGYYMKEIATKQATQKSLYGDFFGAPSMGVIYRVEVPNCEGRSNS